MADNKNIRQQDEPLLLKDLIQIYLTKWKWFVLSLAVCLGAAVLYLLKTPSVYTRSSSLLIEEDTKGQSIASEMNFADLGLFQSNTNVNNEIIAISSPATMQEVVRRLNLDISYSIDGHFHRQTVYGTSLPVNVVFTDLPDNVQAGMTLRILGSDSVRLSEFRLKDEKRDSKLTVTGRIGEEVSTPLGKVTVSPTPFFVPDYDGDIYVSKNSIYGATAACSSSLTVTLANKEATVINLSYDDVSVERANDVLNTLISVYNENWIKDKNQIAVSTSVFIDERLAVIERELGIVDEDISSYKSENLISDLQSASTMYMEQSSQTSAEILALNNRLYMTRYIRDYLTNDANRFQLLPAGTGIESGSIEGQISEYNTVLLQRNNLVANSSSSNPLVVDMDQSLTAMRSAIITSLDNHIVMLNTQMTALQGQERQATDRMAATPDQAKYLLSVERQQKVKEALYLFLLQKREENELSQAFTAYNTRLITPPTGKMSPTTPVPARILLVAMVLGFGIPMAVFFLLETTNTRIRGRKDLERLSVPFIGELPLYSPKKKKLLSVPHLHRRDEEMGIVVREGSRNVINEAFRVLRTNLEFMTGNDRRTDVFMTTSFNPGSGKTFVTTNLAKTLSIKKRRVLVIDGDLRHGSASALAGSPKTGLSDWLGGRIRDVDGCIVPVEDDPFLSLLPVGTIPPNPTELLMDERLAGLIERYRSSYDYVFIDCPPINIVADTQIIGKLADRTIFITRAGLLERSMLSELETVYGEGRYPGMCLVLNGTENTGGRYGYRYGYRYGRYGYGYHSYDYYSEK